MLRKLVLVPISLLLFLAIVVAWTLTHTAKAEPIGFPDVTADWQVAAVSSAVAVGYVDGYPDGTFRPDASVSRAEFMSMLVKALKLPPLMSDRSTWYAPYFAVLKRSFVYREDFPVDAADESMTRQEMINLAYRAIHPELQKESVLMGNKELVYNAVKSGIIQGLSKGDLALDGLTTRAQAVVVIDRLLQLKSGHELAEVDKHALSVAEVELMGSNFLSTIHMEPIELPATFPTVYGVDVTIQQMIIADPKDPEDPYAGKVPPLEIANSVKGQDLYYLIFKYHLENPHYQDQEHKTFRFRQGLGINSGWIMTGVTPDVNQAPYEFNWGDVFFLDHQPTGLQKDAYEFFIQPKAKLDAFLAGGGLPYLSLVQVNGSKSFPVIIWPSNK
jgi:hypothetical protein